jgi:cobyrinic acid a,c-diamide synthase
MRLGPRVVVAGTASDVGKTTVATGLMAALRTRGHKVGAAKVGPDFIDPGYHTIAAGRPSRNLDLWMCGRDPVPKLAGRATEGAGILVVEGVMGLFDGAADGTPSSTAAVAKLLDAPVLLVVDAAAVAQSVAALVHGFATYDPALHVAGVVLNKVGSPGHEEMLRAALAPLGLPIVGVLPRDDACKWRDRHLGLVPVVEEPDTIKGSIARLGELVRSTFDLDAVFRIAAKAPCRDVPPPPLPDPPQADKVRVAVAAGAAFSFAYPDNAEALTAAGAELVPFDPCTDPALPAGIHGLIAGGGFPEMYAAALAANTPMLADVRSRISRGLVTWAECGGLVWLCESLDGKPMAGAVPAHAVMTDRLTLGYRRATFTTATPLGGAGTTVRGHEFHYSTVEPAGTALDMSGRGCSSLGGFASDHLLASYLHLHLGARPDLAVAFVDACRTLYMPYVKDLPSTNRLSTSQRT